MTYSVVSPFIYPVVVILVCRGGGCVCGWSVCSLISYLLKTLHCLPPATPACLPPARLPFTPWHLPPYLPAQKMEGPPKVRLNLHVIELGRHGCRLFLLLHTREALPKNSQCFAGRIHSQCLRAAKRQGALPKIWALAENNERRLAREMSSSSI